MLPEFRGEPEILHRFLQIGEKLCLKFYNQADENDFQNEFLISSILSKIKHPASELVFNATITSWASLKATLLTAYADKRDAYTLAIEMAESRQKFSESPFDYYNRIQKLLNLQISYFINHVEPPDQAPILIQYSRAFALRVFLKGLKEPLGQLMRTKNPPDLNAALQMLTNDFQFHEVNQPPSQKFSKIKSSNFNPKINPQNHPHKALVSFPHNSSPPQRPINSQNFFNGQNPQHFARPAMPQNFGAPTPMSIGSTRNTRYTQNNRQFRPMYNVPLQRGNAIIEEVNNLQTLEPQAIDYIPQSSQTQVPQTDHSSTDDFLEESHLSQPIT